MTDLPWTDEQLQPYREMGDPPADEMIAALVQGGQVPAVNVLMRHLVQNEYPIPESLPPAVRAYLDRTDDLPDWADRARLEAGERVFVRYGPELVVILHCYSLPFCYLGVNGVQVLNLTDRLESNPTRRILETAQMLVDVMQPGGLAGKEGRGPPHQPGGPGGDADVLLVGRAGRAEEAGRGAERGRPRGVPALLERGRVAAGHPARAAPARRGARHGPGARGGAAPVRPQPGRARPVRRAGEAHRLSPAGQRLRAPRAGDDPLLPGRAV